MSKELPEIIKSIIQSNDTNTQLENVKTLRKVLISTEDSLIIDTVIESGVLPYLVQFLSENNNNTCLQFESLWSVSCISESESQHHIESIINANVVPELIKLLQNSLSSEKIINMSIWTLCFIVDDFRDYILQMGIMPPLLNIINNQPNISILRGATCILAHLFHGKPLLDKDLINIAIPTLAQLLINDNDEEVIKNSARALSYYTENSNDRVQELINFDGVCKRLVTLLTHQNNSIVKPILKIVRNISCGDDLQTESIVNNDTNVLNGLLQLLSHKKIKIRKEVCWIISNIAGANNQIIQSIIDAKIIPKVITIISDENEDLNVKINAMWIINGIFSNGRKDQIDHVVKDLGCLLSVVNLLENCKDYNLLYAIMDTLLVLFDSGDNFKENNNSINPYIECMESCDGFEKVRFYSNYSVLEITNLVSAILSYKNEIDIN
ncbi:hypothetical protein ABK040_016890 [Willaertia magna]